MKIFQSCYGLALFFVLQTNLLQPNIQANPQPMVQQGFSDYSEMTAVEEPSELSVEEKLRMMGVLQRFA